MAVTVPSFWQLQVVRQIEPAHPIADDTDHDLETLVQRENRNFAFDTRLCMAMGGVAESRPLDEAGVTTYTERYKGHVKVWKSQVRTNFHVYGQNVDVRIMLGAVTLHTINCGATLQWYSSTAALSSVLTLGSDNEILLTVEAQENTASGGRSHSWWILEETPLATADMPDRSGVGSTYQRIDDEAVQADRPTDGYLFQTLFNNAKEILRVRTRGCGFFWPLSELPTHSSVFPRADGPYVLGVDPWADAANMLVTVTNSSVEDMTISAFSEWEREEIEDVITLSGSGGRAQTIAGGAGPTALHFGGLQVKPGARNKFYVYLKSDIAGTKTSTFSAIQQRGGERRLVALTGALSTLPIGAATGYAIKSEKVDGNFTAGEKGTTTGQWPSKYWDLASNLTDNLSESQALLSPAPGIVQTQVDGGASPTYDLFQCGRIAIHSVWLDASAEDIESTVDELHAASLVDELPSASLVRRASALCNLASIRATAQIGIRGGGQRTLSGDRTAGSKTFKRRGIWAFAPGGSANWHTVARWAVGSDPRGSVTTERVEIDKIEAVAYFRAVSTTQLGEHEDAQVQWRLVSGGVAGTQRNQIVPLRHVVEPPSLLTHWDAGMAAQVTPNDDLGGGNADVFEHGYVQQLAWFPEAFRSDLWRTSPLLQADHPASYPAFIEVQARLDSTIGNDAFYWLITAGAECEYSERIQP